jgi:predicted translin family RNA/ssDNA-binding protein
MPVEIKDLDNGLGTYIRGWGVIKKGELTNNLKRHAAQDGEKLKKYRYSLSDYIEITETDVSQEYIDQTADILIKTAKINPDIIVATVASQDYIFGLSRMGEILRSSGGWEEMVFRNIEDAKNWIRKRVKEKYGIENLTFK